MLALLVCAGLTGCATAVPQADELVALCRSLERAQQLGMEWMASGRAASVDAISSEHDQAARALREAEDRAPSALRGPLGRRAAWHERIVEQAAVASTPEELQQQLGSDGVLYLTGASEAESDYDAIRHFVQDHCNRGS